MKLKVKTLHRDSHGPRIRQNAMLLSPNNKKKMAALFIKLEIKHVVLIIVLLYIEKEAMKE